MGDACSPKNLAATITAKSQISGNDIFTEAERYNAMNGDQRANYERFMANALGIKPKAKDVKSIWDGLPKNKAATLADHALVARPSEVLKGKFWDSVNGRLKKWQSGTADRETYNKQVAKPARDAIKAIDDIVQSGKNIDIQLNKLGLKKDTVYEAKNYLSWLEKGGHLQGEGEAKWLTDRVSKISQAQAAFNVSWTVNNGVDLMRIASNVNPMTTLKAAAKTLASKNRGFSELSEFKESGIYNKDRIETQGLSKFDPFQATNTFQKNFAANIAKVTGKDVSQTVRDHVFESTPWDKPRGERFQGSKLVFGLGRYSINEARWYYRTARNAVTGDAKAAATLISYSILKSVVTGSASAIPYPVWLGLSKEQKKAVKEFDDRTPFLNLVKKGSQKAFETIGLKEVALDVSTSTQPFGGTLGATAEKLVTDAVGIGGQGVKTVGSLASGKPTASLVHGLAAFSAMANYGVLSDAAGKIGKWQEEAGNFEKSVLNNKMLTDMLKNTADSLEKEFDGQKFAKGVAQATFGKQNIKKAN